MKIALKTSRAKKQLWSVCNTGIYHETNESGKIYIVALNLLCLIFFATNLFAAFSLSLFTDNTALTVFFSWSGLIFLFPIYLNGAGYLLVAKMFLTLFLNNIFLFFALGFSHDNLLANYFLVLLISSNCLFNQYQKKWFITSLVTSVLYYFLAAFLKNQIPFGQELNNPPAVGFVILTSKIILIVAEIFAFVYLLRMREKLFERKHAQLRMEAKEVEVQNADLKIFNAAASHALQTPIYVSQYFLTKLKNNHFQSGEAKTYYKNIKIIDDCLLLMDQIVNGLFSYTRVIHFEEELNTFSTAAEILKVKKEMLEKYPGCRIFNAAKDFSITTNKMVFSIILQNLIDNGLKYNRSEHPTIFINLKQNKNNLSFSITDNGIGIDEKMFEKIFEPFVKVNTNQEFTGNGLGLSSARKAAERIGGKVICSSSSATGSTFQLDLPVNFPEHRTQAKFVREEVDKSSILDLNHEP